MCNCWQSASKNFFFFSSQSCATFLLFFFKPPPAYQMWSCTDAVTQWELPTATLLPVYAVGWVLAMWKQLMKVGFSSRGPGEPSPQAHLSFQLIIHHCQEAAGLPGNLVFLCVCDSDSSRLRDDSQCSPGSWSCRPTPRPPPRAGKWPRASRPPLCATPSRPCTQSFQ